MSQKVRELRNQADEVARETLVRMSEGEAPLLNERKDFEDLMRLVSNSVRPQAMKCSWY